MSPSRVLANPRSKEVRRIVLTFGSLVLCCLAAGCDRCGEKFSLAADAPTASLSANPAIIAPNGTTTLTWSSTNASSCTGNVFSTGNAISGSVSVAPTKSTNYSIICNGAGGTTTGATFVTVMAAGRSLVSRP